MGYNTEFSGKLTFAQELTVRQLVALKEICGEDCRDHPEWTHDRTLDYIQLKITDDYAALVWTGAEKTDKMVEHLNVLILEMRKKWPDFGVVGSLAAQGERLEDRGMLEIGTDGLAYKVPMVVAGTIITCPKCDHRFVLEEQKKV